MFYATVSSLCLRSGGDHMVDGEMTQSMIHITWRPWLRAHNSIALLYWVSRIPMG